jgi:hypothetical protein
MSGYQAGPPGRETTYFTDVYKNKQTGQQVVFDNLDKKSPRPDPSKFEPIAPQTRGKPKGGKSRKRKVQKKKRSTRKH